MEQQCLDKLAKAVLHAADRNDDEKLQAEEWALIVTAVINAETSAEGAGTGMFTVEFPHDVVNSVVCARTSISSSYLL